MEILEYRAAPGAIFPQNKAGDIGSFLKDLYDEFGELTPDIVIEHARGSPLEDYITWDTIEASRKQWLNEARHIINHINIVIKGEKGVEVRGFHQISLVIERGEVIEGKEVVLKVRKVYKPIDQILASEQETQELLEDILQKFVDLRNKYYPYRELDSIFKAIDKVSRDYKLLKD